MTLAEQGTRPRYMGLSAADLASVDSDWRRIRMRLTGEPDAVWNEVGDEGLREAGRLFDRELMERRETLRAERPAQEVLRS